MASTKSRILIIDDDHDFIEAMKLALAEKGYDILTAYSGMEGIEKARNTRPDLIILDIIMPHENGFTACEQIKANVNLSAIPVIIVTNIARRWSETSISRREGFSLEAEGYFDKSVQPEELVGRIEELL